MKSDDIDRMVRREVKRLKRGGRRPAKPGPFDDLIEEEAVAYEQSKLEAEIRQRTREAVDGDGLEALKAAGRKMLQEQTEQPPPPEPPPSPEPREPGSSLVDRVLRSETPEPDPAPPTGSPENDEAKLRQLASRMGRTGAGSAPVPDPFGSTTGLPRYERGSDV